jgi:hypothetical protein
MTFIEIENHIRKTNDLIKLKKDLKNYLICFKTLEEKNDFLDFIELDFLKRHKVKIEKDIELYSEQKVSLFISLGKDAIFKIDCIEKWILENRKEINLIKPFKNNINNDIKHPFKSDEIYKVFQYLDEYFKSKSKAKYTYIFDFIKSNLENTLNETLYFDFIISSKQIDMVNRAQATAFNLKKIELVKNLYLDYSNNTKK